MAAGQNHDTSSLHAFAGTWKENLDKSHTKPPSTARLSYTRSSDGLWTETRDTGGAILTMNFRRDGKEYPLQGVPGVTESWKETGPNGWESTSKRDGRVIGTTSRIISNDSKRLTITFTPIAPDNKQPVTTWTYERAGTGNGLAGKWKAVALENKTPGVMSIEVTGTWEIKERDMNGGTFTARPDGKEYGYTGARIIPNVTVAVRETGPRSLEETYFRNHQPIMQAEITVSEDDRTLTRTATDSRTHEQISTSVLEKQ